MPTMTKTRRALSAVAVGAVLAGGITVASVVPAEAVSASGSAKGKTTIRWACKDFGVPLFCRGPR